MTEHGPTAQARVKWVGLLAGPALAALAYVLLPETYSNTLGELLAFSHAGRMTAALGVWMATWWMTQAMPVSVTALLPLAVLPISGAMPITEVAAPYAHELIFLFMGGFILALSMQRWGLHRRFAFAVLRGVGSEPLRLVGGFMLITAALSMWVSNTATTIMMLPIALSVIAVFEGTRDGQEPTRPSPASDRARRNFALCLLLGVAYAASIGGIGTLIGTPPNLFLASYAKSNLDVEISFVRWMGVGLPLVATFLPLTWLLLTRALFPIDRRELPSPCVDEVCEDLGPMGRGERVTLVVFAAAALLWVTRPLLEGVSVAGGTPFAGLSDTAIAMAAAIALFVIPVDVGKSEFVMDWKTASKLPWGLLLLFGGGLSLAASVKATGVGEFIANQVASLAGLPPVVVVLLVVTLLIFLTELTSNTATTATLVPILAALAPGMGLPPLLLIVPAAIAASCAFMLPVATPPNAIVFGSGYVTVPQMARAGIWLNIVGIALITALTYAVAMPLLGAR
jgi:sodium-dependent dicarboxylate transporter 2/3/5